MNFSNPEARVAMPGRSEGLLPLPQLAAAASTHRAIEIWIELLVDPADPMGRPLIDHTVRALEAFIFQGQLDMRVRLDLDDEEDSWLIIECQKLEDMDDLGQMIGAFDLRGWTGEGGLPPPAYAKPAGSSRGLTGERVDVFMFGW